MSDRRLAIDAWESLFRAQHEIFAEISADFDADGLQQAEYDALLTVTRAPHDTVRLREITRNMLISQPSVSRLVDRMVEKGLLVKIPDPDDARSSLVRATAEGIRQFRAIAARHARSIADRMSDLTDDELRTLRALTAKLRRHRE